MKYNPEVHHRRSIRLEGYDYSQAGAYFVTICTQNRVCLFGGTGHGDILLCAAGEMVRRVWENLPDQYPGVETDAFVVMPNHFHGIIILTGGSSHGQFQPGRPAGGQPRRVAPTGLSLPDVVHRFKVTTTKHYIDGVKYSGWPPFPGKIWQRNYHDHIIPSEPELYRIREYILNNPAQWDFDCENPCRIE